MGDLNPQPCDTGKKDTLMHESHRDVASDGNKLHQILIAKSDTNRELAVRVNSKL